MAKAAIERADELLSALTNTSSAAKGAYQELLVETIERNERILKVRDHIEEFLLADTQGSFVRIIRNEGLVGIARALFQSDNFKVVDSEGDGLSVYIVAATGPEMATPGATASCTRAEAEASKVVQWISDLNDVCSDREEQHDPSRLYVNDIKKLAKIAQLPQDSRKDALDSYWSERDLVEVSESDKRIAALNRKLVEDGQRFFRSPNDPRKFLSE